MQADKLAAKINVLIKNNVAHRYADLSNAAPKALWRQVNDLNRPTANAHFLRNTDVNVFNRFFANNSFDNTQGLDFAIANQNKLTTTNSVVTVVKKDVVSLESNELNELNGSSELNLFNEQIEPVTVEEVELILRKTKATTPGIDNLPAWVFKRCSVELADVVTRIFNLSISSGKVPTEWLTAVVTPVPKIDKPSDLSHYRPISVTPILSRMAERLITKKYLQPSIPISKIRNQYAFKPSGSTTCAFVHMLHKISFYLEHRTFVRCLMIDFKAAFDVVNRTLLLRKVTELDIPTNIKHWLANFLSNRKQRVKCNGVESGLLCVNQGVVQGSAVGPCLFTIMISDLETISPMNEFIKFADDVSLLVPEGSDVSIEDEYQAINTWAQTNKLIINLTKTKEIVFHRPSPRIQVLPPVLLGIERVIVAKLLGVFINSSINFSCHVDFIVSQCSQRMYLLRALRNRGLSVNELQAIFMGIILSRVMYAASAWGGLFESFGHSAYQFYL